MYGTSRDRLGFWFRTINKPENVVKRNQSINNQTQSTTFSQFTTAISLFVYFDEFFLFDGLHRLDLRRACKFRFTEYIWALINRRIAVVSSKFIHKLSILISVLDLIWYSSYYHQLSLRAIHYIRLFVLHYHLIEKGNRISSIACICRLGYPQADSIAVASAIQRPILCLCIYSKSAISKGRYIYCCYNRTTQPLNLVTYLSEPADLGRLFSLANYRSNWLARLWISTRCVSTACSWRSATVRFLRQHAFWHARWDQ